MKSINSMFEFVSEDTETFRPSITSQQSNMKFVERRSLKMKIRQLGRVFFVLAVITIISLISNWITLSYVASNFFLNSSAQSANRYELSQPQQQLVVQSENTNLESQLDFFIIGFPKSGTTTLLYSMMVSFFLKKVPYKTRASLFLLAFHFHNCFNIFYTYIN